MLGLGCAHTGFEPRSPSLLADSLPAEPQGKPKNTGVDSLFPSLGDLSSQGSCMSIKSQ